MQSEDASPDPVSGASAADQLPIRIEREHLPDGRAITYYSRPDDAGVAAAGRPDAAAR